MAFTPPSRMGRCLGALPPKRMAASWSGSSQGLPNARLRRNDRARWQAPPRIVQQQEKTTCHELILDGQSPMQGAAEMPVIGAAFLFAIGRAFARIHVKYDGLRPSPPAHFVDPLTGQIGQRSKILGPAQ